MLFFALECIFWGQISTPRDLYIRNLVQTVCYSFPIAPSSLLASPLAKLNSQGSAESAAVPLLLFPEISNQRTDINHTPTSNLVMIPWLCVRTSIAAAGVAAAASPLLASRRLLAFLLVRTSSTLKLSLAAREQSFFPLAYSQASMLGENFDQLIT